LEHSRSSEHSGDIYLLYSGDSPLPPKGRHRRREIAALDVSSERHLGHQGLMVGREVQKAKRGLNSARGTLKAKGEK